MAEKAVVFDKAAFHLESVRGHGLDERQAGVHVGLFFGWAVDRRLTAAWLERNTPGPFVAFRNREISGPVLLASWDGAILDDMFSDEGLAFVAEYFDPRSGAYVDDYLRTLAAGLPSEFHVQDTPENAAKIGAVLDARYAAWRETWDPASGRPDLRMQIDPVAADELPLRLVLPVLPVTSGIPLPGGSLGVRATRADSLAAVEAALAGDRRLLLLATQAPGRKPTYAPSDLLSIGVVAEVLSAKPSPDHPASRDVMLVCLARVEVEGWEAGPTLRARTRLFEVPEPKEADFDSLEELRFLVGEAVRRRAERHESPGVLALGVSLHGAQLVDAIGRELALSREESLLLLEAPDLATRTSVVLDAVRRHS